MDEWLPATMSAMPLKVTENSAVGQWDGRRNEHVEIDIADVAAPRTYYPEALLSARRGSLSSTMAECGNHVMPARWMMQCRTARLPWHLGVLATPSTLCGIVVNCLETVSNGAYKPLYQPLQLALGPFPWRSWLGCASSGVLRLLPQSSGTSSLGPSSRVRDAGDAPASWTATMPRSLLSFGVWSVVRCTRLDAGAACAVDLGWLRTSPAVSLPSKLGSGQTVHWRADT